MQCDIKFTFVPEAFADSNYMASVESLKNCIRLDSITSHQTITFRFYFGLHF
jgi:hypothetical protein